MRERRERARVSERRGESAREREARESAREREERECGRGGGESKSAFAQERERESGKEHPIVRDCDRVSWLVG